MYRLRKALFSLHPIDLWIDLIILDFQLNTRFVFFLLGFMNAYHFTVKWKHRSVNSLNPSRFVCCSTIIQPFISFAFSRICVCIKMCLFVFVSELSVTNFLSFYCLGITLNNYSDFLSLRDSLVVKRPTLLLSVLDLDRRQVKRVKGRRAPKLNQITLVFKTTLLFTMFSNIYPGGNNAAGTFLFVFGDNTCHYSSQ